MHPLVEDRLDLVLCQMVLQVGMVEGRLPRRGSWVASPGATPFHLEPDECQPKPSTFTSHVGPCLAHLAP